MKKSFYRFILTNICIVSLILLFISFYMVKTVDNSSVKKTVDDTFNNIISEIDSSNMELKGILNQVSEDNIAKAKALALIINHTSNTYMEPEALEEIRVGLFVDEILITDEKGIVIAGTSPYLGQNFNTDENYKEFLPAIEDKSFAKVVNTFSGDRLIQHIAVSRIDSPGIIYIEVAADSLKDTVRLSGISTIINNQYIMKKGKLSIIDKETWTYVSHTDQEKINTASQIPKDKMKKLSTTGKGSFKLKIEDKKYLIYYREYDKYIITAQISVKEVYLRRNYTIVSMLISVFLITLTVMLSIRKKLIDIKLD